jgi:two-component SAPR family response regulator
MRAVIIDDELPAINEIKYLLENFGVQVAGTFTNPQEGFNFVILDKPNIVFLDINMPILNGLDLGMQIRSCCLDIFIIYITSYPQYALDSFQAYPLDYLLKPINEARFKETLQRIRGLYDSRSDLHQAVLRIKCFGDFNIIIENKEVKMPGNRVAELLAYLLCHYQQALTQDQLVKSLFNSNIEERNKNNFRVTMFRLRHVLMDLNINKEMLLIRDDLSIKVQPGICDLIDFINFIDDYIHINEYNADRAFEIIEAIDGDIFSDMDVDWLMDIQEAINVQVEELMLKTATYYIKGKTDLSRAEKILIKLINFNNLSERGYILLLEQYMKTESKTKYCEAFKHYAQMMKFDLDLSPERRFTEHYVKLKNKFKENPNSE